MTAAAAVMFGHSFIVSLDSARLDWMSEFGRSLSVAAVETFFILSGYLVTQSFERSGSALRFVLARTLRIAPGLIACVLVSALVFGPLFTKLPVADYFAAPQLLRFTAHNSILDVFSSPFLPAVSFHDSKGGDIINGSLWSLPFEFAFYSIVLVFGVLGRLNGRTAGCLLGLALGSLAFRVLDGYGWFLSYFAAGMCMYYVRKRHRLVGWIACAAALAVVVGNYAGMPWPMFPILGSYFIIYVALGAPFEIKQATRFGDLSYGIYLYGWPAEEIAVHLLGGTADWWQVLALALPISALCALFSWHCVEAPALRWKDIGMRSMRQCAAVAAIASYGAVASIFGIGKIFALGCLLPATLAIGLILCLTRLRLAPSRVVPGEATLSR